MYVLNNHLFLINKEQIMMCTYIDMNSKLYYFRDIQSIKGRKVLKGNLSDFSTL